jgi:hypothetical protein
MKNPLSWISKVSKLAQETREATRSVARSIAELRRELAEKRRELEHARSAPLPPADVERRIASFVDAQRARWSAEHARSVVGAFGTATEETGMAVARLARLDKLRFEDLCALLPDAMKSSLVSLCAAVSYDAGPAENDRARVIERLESELRELEQAEEAVVDEALEAGVTVEHRPEVVERRDGERLRAERIAAAEAAQKARDAVSAEYRALGAPSPYLTNAAADRAAMRADLGG